MPASSSTSSPNFVSLSDDMAKRVLHHALERLSPVQRQVFLLRLRGDGNLEAMAERLGMPLDSVKASLAFAISQLRLMLSEAPMDRSRNDWLQRCGELLRLEPKTADMPASVTQVASSASVVTSETQNSSVKIKKTQNNHHDRVIKPSAKSARWALALVLCLVVGLGTWLAIGALSGPKTLLNDAEPQRMPEVTAPEAPLTAPDFLLVFLRQQYPEVLDDLAFYVWLSEQEAQP